jgi:hypothetical protein
LVDPSLPGDEIVGEVDRQEVGLLALAPRHQFTLGPLGDHTAVEGGRLARLVR